MRNLMNRNRRASQLWSGSGVIETLSVFGGVVDIGRTLTPRNKTDKLYNEGGTLKWNGLDVTSQGVTNFYELDDTPSNYGSKSLQLLRVNVGDGTTGTAIEFTDEIDGGAI